MVTLTSCRPQAEGTAEDQEHQEGSEGGEGEGSARKEEKRD
jgi:hypothetical protein